MNVWYDLGHKPEPGSPLESVYALLFQARQDADYLKTFMTVRAILDAPLQTVEGVQTGNELKNLVEEYTETVYPFAKADKRKVIDEMTKALRHYVNEVAAIEAVPLPTLTEKLRIHRRMAESRQRYSEQVSKTAQQLRRSLN